MSASKGPRAAKAVTNGRADAFLGHLAATSNVRASCRLAGLDQSSLYKFRADHPEFAERWEQALQQGYLRLEGELLRHAMGNPATDETAPPPEGGDAVPPFDPELALRVLGQRRSADAQGRRAGPRLKQPSERDVLMSLDRKLTAMEKKLAREPGQSR